MIEVGHGVEFIKKVVENAEKETQGWKMMIGGEWVESKSEKRFLTYNPSTNMPLAEIPEGNAEDVNLAVEAASKAFTKWGKMHVSERAKILKKFAQAVRDRAEEFGMLEALDSGNPYKSMINDTLRGTDFIDYFCGIGMEIKGNTISTPGGGLNYTRLQPFGVVARILPFNHPIYFAISKIAAPLVAGNTVIIKPAEQTPLTALLLGKLAMEYLPPGVLNIVTGDGPNCGGALVKHKKIRRISFTGGVETGRNIVQNAGIKSVSLELGGKNPLIIYPDVDLEKVAATAVAGMNFSVCQGQSCGSNSRIFVHQEVHDLFLEELIKKVKKIRQGLPELLETEMGPVITQEHYQKVMSYIETGQQQGAGLVYGGKHPVSPEMANGNFIEPTVFTGVQHGMDIEQNEIFGPVMSILSWEDEKKMLEEVNDVEYGLAAHIWTNDITTALRRADEIEAGYVWINGVGSKRFMGAPFGGTKESGFGKEHSIDELLSYTQMKNVNVHY
ncbi:aldehyde dehydrogenase [Alkalihalophilus pseudofirmus]|nr:aldehyde dehydrogenase [Alkalihalophilus pseudofirmus]